MLLNLKRLTVGESGEVCVEKEYLAVLDGLDISPPFDEPGVTGFTRSESHLLQ